MVDDKHIKKLLEESEQQRKKLREQLAESESRAKELEQSIRGLGAREVAGKRPNQKQDQRTHALDEHERQLDEN
jgi:hypothetical protein